MKYDPKTECDVLLAIRELGEGTTEEIHEYTKTINKDLLTRYLRRWKAKKIVAANYIKGVVVWKLADIPPFYMSGIMALVKGTINEDMRVAMDALDETLKTQGRIIKPKSVWGGYKFVNVVFETIDPILGGRRGNEDGKLFIPKTGNKRFIPSSWIRAWIGTNAGLRNLPQSIKYRVVAVNSELPEFKPETIQLKVKIGLCNYEAIPKGTQFTVRMAFPLRGCELQTIKSWMEYLAMIGETPLRGLGANPFALGGRVKLVSHEIV